MSESQESKPGAFVSKRKYAALIGVSNAMVHKHAKAGRLVVTDAGLVDVEASNALIRAASDPGRGGKGGFTMTPRAPGPMDLPPSAGVEAKRLWDTAPFDDDTPGSPGSSRSWFPAPMAFHEIADRIRTDITRRLRHSIDDAGRGGSEAVYKEFRARLEDETGVLAQLLYHAALDIVRQHVELTGLSPANEPR